MSSNINISAVRVEGAKVTRSSFLGFLINPQLASVNATPSTLESVLHTTRKIAHTLNKTDMFHSVEAKLERARDELANEGDVDIVFKTREKGRFYLNTSTELGNNEGNAVCYVCFCLSVVLMMHCRLQLAVSGTYLGVLKYSKPMSHSVLRRGGHSKPPWWLL